MPHVIAEPCVGRNDGACAAACPTDSIHGGERMMYINPNECIDCGACVESCPANAIFPSESLPERWKFYAEVNRRFFAERDEEKAWAGVDLPSGGLGIGG